MGGGGLDIHGLDHEAREGAGDTLLAQPQVLNVGGPPSVRGVERLNELQQHLPCIQPEQQEAKIRHGVGFRNGIGSGRYQGAMLTCGNKNKNL